MILDEILHRTKIDLDKKMSEIPFEILQKSFFSVKREQKDVINALKSSKNDPIKIIAEIKKSSPSKGVIRENFNPIEIAKIYEKIGVCAISILTEENFFHGRLDYLTAINQITKIPLLRKDFIIDKYQILESYIYGADLILLIAKALSGEQLKELLNFANNLGLFCLVETHDKDDIKKAIFAGAEIIGINHRNLQTFKMDMSLCEKLIPIIPNGKIIVAESGLESHKTLIELNKIGVDAFLIGEYFMRSDDIEKSFKELKG